VCPPHRHRHEVDVRLFVIKKVWRAHKDAKSYVTQLCFLEKNKVIFVCVIALRKETRKHDGGSLLLFFNATDGDRTWFGSVQSIRIFGMW
jgi:hypothetical protein